MDQNRVLDYYRKPSAITDISRYDEFANWLTGDVRSIAQVVQGILIHDAWLERYGINYRKEQSCPSPIAYMQDILEKAEELDTTSLAIPRSPDKRVIGCCREFATMLCAILRYKGIPARSRCGFGAYFAPGLYEDHWICEYWDHEAGRWVRVDPQMDPFQQSYLGLDFSPMDIPAGKFLVSGEAWRLCRSKPEEAKRFGISANPRDFGLENLYGLWFVRGNLLRDFAALNKVETVPLLIRLGKKLTWESWRLVAAQDSELSPVDYELLDKVAEFSCDPDRHFEELRAFYQSNIDLQPPEDIISRDWK
jgi:hypothetical protein